MNSTSALKNKIDIFRDELTAELSNILQYWANNSVDNINGGFLGRIDENNLPDLLAPKAAVLNARILWTFSAAINFNANPVYPALCQRAYVFIKNNFFDEEYGAVYWSVDYRGTPLETKKQAYAIAFTIYALAEYYKCSKDEHVKKMAISLFEKLEKHFYDPEYGGYFEAFSRSWNSVDDLRLSDKDQNEKKTMNTHLHILEAYTNLYRIWPNELLLSQIRSLLKIFSDKIIDTETGHLGLFFDEQWNLKSNVISFGHDIEASWLLQEAAELIKNEDLNNEIRTQCEKLSVNALQALDAYGGMWYEKNEKDSVWVKEKHWWVQAEAMAGFVNAWQQTGEEKFINKALEIWQFIKQHIKDNQYGEWIWGVDENNLPLPLQDKTGMWKCPYHNSRACIEIINRLQRQ